MQPIISNQPLDEPQKEYIEAARHKLELVNKRQVLNKRWMTFSASFLRTFILIGLCFIITLPFLQKISFALRHPSDISNPQVIWIPATFSLENIRIAFYYLSYSITFFNTMIVASVATLIQIIATAVAGYTFARLRFKGSNILFYIILCTLVVPNETLGMARFLHFQHQTFFGISLIYNVFAIFIMSMFGMGVRSAIFIYLFRQFFRNIPIELEESAEIDGAGVVRTFWSVMLPNARGAIVTVALFAFVWQYNDYYFANLFKYERSMPLLATQLASGSGNLYGVLNMLFQHLLADLGREISMDQLFYGLIANTAALLMMLPLLIGYFFVQRLFVESIERAGITGM